MSLVCSWCKFGVFLVPGREPACAAVPCTLHGGKGRSAPCNPAFARTQPTARRSERRAACGWTACARAYHRAAPRYGLLRPSASTPAVESGLLGAVPARARPSSSRPRCTLGRLCASRYARNFQETFRCAETCPETSVLSPLTRAAEGVRAWQAVRRRAGHGARAAPMPERLSHGRRTTRKVPK